MSRLKVYLPSNCLKLYYNSYILSVMDYCCTVWGNASCTHIDKLCKLQKRAARIILNATTETPSAVMFKKLEWLTIYNRHCMKHYLLFAFSIHQKPIGSSSVTEVHISSAFDEKKMIFHLLNIQKDNKIQPFSFCQNKKVIFHLS